MPNRDLENIRNHYQRNALDWSDIDDDPLLSLRAWLDDAIQAKLYEPTALTLATIDSMLQPHARVVLLKGIDHGLLFYTNYASPKGQEIDSNPNVAATLFWPELERQIRIEGRVEKISASQSDDYFHSRPRDSQLAAVASAQGQVVANRDVLEARFADLQAQYADQTIPRPDHWGGYRLIPQHIEFWQGRPNRLHDRLMMRRANEVGEWIRERLSP
jgi:pyridoxamine 5'-phosphate oxidase